MSKNKEMGEEENETEELLPIESDNLETEVPAVNEQSVFSKEIEAQKEKYIRLLAEFENYKRRTAKERIEQIKTAGLEVITDLLPALDDVDRAQAAIADAKDIEALKAGLQLIDEKFRTTLHQKGLVEIECVGKDFDVELMESIAEIPAMNEEGKGKVIEVVQKGYTLNQKIIRYAKVVVGK